MLTRAFLVFCVVDLWVFSVFEIIPYSINILSVCYIVEKTPKLFVNSWVLKKIYKKRSCVFKIFFGLIYCSSGSFELNFFVDIDQKKWWIQRERIGERLHQDQDPLEENDQGVHNEEGEEELQGIHGWSKRKNT